MQTSYGLLSGGLLTNIEVVKVETLSKNIVLLFEMKSVN